ncbi:hypothetical protein FIBSPDRAFT_947527 [Athelia psychrophila]|uniref:Uncharacterized protein n=1 Tax=Athelia psychrophila TaxID=1759441 RepID=A0A166RVJ4_9AGAM|nr:hypothetical protein FIBSPDRAFT_947527 [Fibularhizoctonia sp. CBS 109695]
MAILFGTRMISPFGLLGMVTRNRFKRLIHEQYPHMQEDIEHGGMAAYISEVAIDAALMDAPPAKGSTGPSHIEDETGGGDAMELRHRQTGKRSAVKMGIGDDHEFKGQPRAAPLVIFGLTLVDGGPNSLVGCKAGFAGAVIDREVETKGLDTLAGHCDNAKKHAEGQFEYVNKL